MTVIPIPATGPSGRRVLRLHVPAFGVPAQWLPRITSQRLLHLSVLVLVLGIATSILTTTDLTWWQSMFSALGTFDDFSGYAFNVTLFLAGVGIAIVGFRVAAELRVISERRARKRSGMMVVLVASAGLHLAGVGLMPINVNQFLHERAASGVMLSFLCILATTASARRHIPFQLRRATWIVGIVLVAAIALFVTGVINLTLFELAGFGLIFVWLNVMTKCLGVALDSPQQRAARHERCEHGTPRRPQMRRLASAPAGRRHPRPANSRPSMMTRDASTHRPEQHKALPIPSTHDERIPIGTVRTEDHSRTIRESGAARSPRGLRGSVSPTRRGPHASTSPTRPTPRARALVTR